jgi:hypothetical protein
MDNVKGPPLGMSKKQLEFWLALIILCIIFAVAILLVDFGIKASILEQSNRIRLEMEEWEVRFSGRNSARATQVRDDNDSTHDATISGDVLLVNPPGMETGNGDTGNTPKARNTARKRTEPSRQASARTIQDGDK